MLTDEEAMELMAEDMVIDLPIKHESKPYLMIPLPDGATNGDVIKAMFPNAIIEAVYEPFYGIDVIKVNFYGYGGRFVTFDKDWWNAPYQKGKIQ